MQCCLNGVHINKIPNFLVESHSKTTHAIWLVDASDAAHPLIIPLDLSGVTGSFDVYSLRIAEYENYQGQISIPAIITGGQVFVSTVI